MQITTRLTVAMSATALLLFGVYSIDLVRDEERDLRSTMESELRLLGRALQVATENALRDEQALDIAEMLDRMEKTEKDVEVAVYDEKAVVVTQSLGRRGGTNMEDESVRRALTTGKAEIAYDDPDAPARVTLAVRLTDDDGRLLGALAVSKPLDNLQADLSATRRNALLSVLGFVGLVAFIGTILGRVYIRKPLAGVAAALQRVASDSRTTLDFKRDDEIRPVVDAFNVMKNDLDEARGSLVASQEARYFLERAMERADRLAAIGQLAATVAHEIGSPLHVLIGRARVLVERECDQERVRHNAEIISSQGERISRIVDSLLAYARQRPPTSATVVLPRAVREILDLLGVEARARRVELTLDADRDLPALMCDGDRLQQVVFNLVRNGIQVSPEGSAVEVVLSLHDADRSVCLAVVDHGPGIPVEQRERVFEPFFTTHASTGGTGLGLTVVKSITEACGWRLSVESSTDHGTRFEVLLPFAPEREAT